MRLNYRHKGQQQVFDLGGVDRENYGLTTRLLARERASWSRMNIFGVPRYTFLR